MHALSFFFILRRELRHIRGRNVRILFQAEATTDTVVTFAHYCQCHWALLGHYTH